MYEAAFRDLRRLADWFSAGALPMSGPDGPERLEIEGLLARLGTTAVPLLCRELTGADPRRRDVARDALGAVAAHGADARARVAAELHAVTGGHTQDEAKVVALGLLSELGEHADVQFADPAAIRIRSAIALASHLDTAAEVASAADLMVHQLEAADLIQMLDAMADAAPDAARRLATELALRLDLAAELRDRFGQRAAGLETSAAQDAHPTGPADWRDHTRAAVLADASARRVVIASRLIAGQRRWRRWAVLIDAAGRIDDCLHEDDAGPYGDTAALRAQLCADGYRVQSLEPEHAREVAAAAARLTAGSARALPPAYYLGRDLLDLADAHVGGRRHEPATAALARAIELIGAGEPARAAAILARRDPGRPELAADTAAALAAALLAQHQPAAAIAPLRRAIRAEPDWPLHHWNLAVAFGQLGDDRGCYHALCQFVATSALPSGLAGDPEQPARIARAERRIAELERAASLVGRRLCRPARSPRAARRPARSAMPRARRAPRRLSPP